MAQGNIKGITIAIDGDTKGLDKALKDVDKQSKKTQGELKEIDKALKLDPTNVELIAQKQQLLSEAIQDTSGRLDVLRQAQSQVEEQFQRGDIGVEQYRAFQREVSNTEAQLRGYENQVTSTIANQESLADATQRLDTFFQATGTEVNQFASVLGTNLTNAIRNGTASSDQINIALQRMGREALGADADISSLNNTLRSANSRPIQEVRNELAEVAESAQRAGNEVNGFGNNLKGVVAGLAGGIGIAGILKEAFDVSTLNTKIDITMELDEASASAVRESIRTVTAVIGDEEGALEGVRRQFALNKDASLESNQAVIEGATAISYAYSEIDFKELIQESHEMAKTFEISQIEAMALTDALLKAGFPPDQLDIISEYGNQLKMAGFNAEEIQGIMKAGVETGSWNIDILLDKQNCSV